MKSEKIACFTYLMSGKNAQKDTCNPIKKIQGDKSVNLIWQSKACKQILVSIWPSTSSNF